MRRYLIDYDRHDLLFSALPLDIEKPYLREPSARATPYNRSTLDPDLSRRNPKYSTAGRDEISSMRFRDTGGTENRTEVFVRQHPIEYALGRFESFRVAGSSAFPFDSFPLRSARFDGISVPFVSQNREQAWGIVCQRGVRVKRSFIDYLFIH